MTSSASHGLTIVAAMTLNHVIGENGTLPWRQQSDMKHFRQLTYGQQVIMGRKTYESVGKLHNRQMIVISASRKIPGVIVVPTFQAALETAKEVHRKPTVVIGGAMVYAQAIPHVTRMHLTILDTMLAGDTYFPRFHMQEWRIAANQHRVGWQQPDAQNNYAYRFITLERIMPDESTGRCSADAGAEGRELRSDAAQGRGDTADLHHSE